MWISHPSWNWNKVLLGYLCSWGSAYCVLLCQHIVCACVLLFVQASYTCSPFLFLKANTAGFFSSKVLLCTALLSSSVSSLYWFCWIGLSMNQITFRFFLFCFPSRSSILINQRKGSWKLYNTGGDGRSYYWNRKSACDLPRLLPVSSEWEMGALMYPVVLFHNDLHCHRALVNHCCVSKAYEEQRTVTVKNATSSSPLFMRIVILCFMKNPVPLMWNGPTGIILLLPSSGDMIQVNVKLQAYVFDGNSLLCVW